MNNAIITKIHFFISVSPERDFIAKRLMAINVGIFHLTPVHNYGIDKQMSANDHITRSAFLYLTRWFDIFRKQLPAQDRRLRIHQFLVQFFG